MKKIFQLGICSLCFLGVGCTDKPHAFTGYIEGEFIQVSVPNGGIIDEIFVEKGQTVVAGTPLFAVETERLNSLIKAKEEALLKAESNYINLTKGRRPEEIAVLETQQKQAEIALKLAESDFSRRKKLAEEKYISESEFEHYESRYQENVQRLNESLQNIKVAMLGAREDEIQAARHAVEIASEDLVQAKKDYADAHRVSPKGGVIDDVYFRAGEQVAPSIPILSILPPENRKICFFVPQAVLPSIKIGQKVYVKVDGQEEKIPASIVYISPNTEYTPPVIYSAESRQKLVFLVEALPEDKTVIFPVGLPLTVYLQP